MEKEESNWDAKHKIQNGACPCDSLSDSYLHIFISTYEAEAQAARLAELEQQRIELERL
jgi:hypothetical protein